MSEKKKWPHGFDHTTADGQKRLMAISKGLDSETYVTKYLGPIEEGKDTGCDPLKDGTFKMYPSGDIVDYKERCCRLNGDIT